MTNFPKPWKVEYAKSGRSTCKICQKFIAKEILRLGKMVPATRFDGFMPRWNHAACVLKKPNRITFIDDIEGMESLRWEDQQKLRKYVESNDGGPPGKKAAKVEYGIEVSQTSRAACKGCKQKIKIGEVRMSSGAKVLAWHHINCFMDLYPSIEVEKLSGWESLSASDQEAVQSLVTRVPSTAETDEGKEEEEEEVPQSTVKAGGKRRNDVGSDQKSKVAKGKGDMSTS